MNDLPFTILEGPGPDPYDNLGWFDRQALPGYLRRTRQVPPERPDTTGAVRRLLYSSDITPDERLHKMLQRYSGQVLGEYYRDKLGDYGTYSPEELSALSEGLWREFKGMVDPVPDPPMREFPVPGTNDQLPVGPFTPPELDMRLALMQALRR